MLNICPLLQGIIFVPLYNATLCYT